MPDEPDPTQEQIDEIDQALNDGVTKSTVDGELEERDLDALRKRRREIQSGTGTRPKRPRFVGLDFSDH